MKRLLAILLAAALLAIPIGAGAQAETDNPFNMSFELGEGASLDVGLNDVVPVLFISTETTEGSEVALGALVDVITVDIEDGEDEPIIIAMLKETDPGIGLGTYHDSGGATRAGLAVTAKFSRPIQWGFKTGLGWVVSEATADAVGGKVQARAGVAYTGEVDMDDWTMSDWRLDGVFTIGMLINFPVRQTNPESAVN